MYSINFIFCERKLPIPEEVVKEFPELRWEDVEFLTNDLGEFSLNEFEITEDGNLFLRRPNGTIEKQDFTGEVVFSTMQLSEDYDYVVFFKSLFFKGELKELTFKRLDKKENSLRKEQDKISNEALLLYQVKKNKIWFKFYSFYFNCVHFTLALVRVLLGSLINLTWRVQRIIT